jgi:Zn-dependent M28 family amino/carboxypeptidase
VGARRGDELGAFPELKLRFRFKQESAAALFEQAPSTLEEVLAKADASEPQGFDLPGMMTLSATTGLRRTQSANVIAALEGSDPQLKNEFVVVTAHLDHLGRGSSVDGDSIYNGAHDNAVGIAMLLEMARALDNANARPKRSIMFAAVTAEEKGLLGSAFLAQTARDREQTLVANINIDMPLTQARTHDFVVFGAEHSTLGTTARNAASAEGYRLSPDPAPEEVVFVRSDQFSFVRHGIPALMLFTGSQARDATFDLATLQKEFFEKHYHQPSDDVKLPIDYVAAADLTRIQLRIILEAANGPRPRWKRGDFFEEKFSAGE